MLYWYKTNDEISFNWFTTWNCEQKYEIKSEKYWPISQLSQFAHSSCVDIFNTWWRNLNNKKCISLNSARITGDVSEVLFDTNESSYQYRKFQCGDKTILRPSYLHNGISYTHKMTSLYWIRAQALLRLRLFSFFCRIIVVFPLTSLPRRRLWFAKGHPRDWVGYHLMATVPSFSPREINHFVQRHRDLWIWNNTKRIWRTLVRGET